MRNWLKSVISKVTAPKAALPPLTPTLLTASPSDPKQIDETPLYPPTDPGIPADPVAKVLDRQRDLITRIHRAAGVPDAAFESYYAAPIRNLAAYVHSLPATDATYFVGAGGLMRLSLEIGLHALQLSHTSQFPTIGSVEKRTAIMPRWELATFLAAICSQLYRPITNMVVTTQDNVQWPQILMPLSDWCTSVGASRYFLRWTPGRDSADRQSCATYILNHIIPAEVLQYINEDNQIIVPTMTAAISGVDLSPSENPIARIIAPITTRIIQEDIKQNSRHYGNYSVGIHLEPHLIDAMRRLIKNGKWAINSKGGRVWVGQDGVFVIWGAGAKEVIGLLTADSFVGLPQDPDTLADILIDAGVLQPNSDGTRYWSVLLPESGTLIDNAVRLVTDQLIFSTGYDLSPLRTTTLSVRSGSKETAAESPDENAPAKPANPRKKAPKPESEKAPAAPAAENLTEPAAESPPVVETVLALASPSEQEVDMPAMPAWAALPEDTASAAPAPTEAQPAPRHAPTPATTSVQPGVTTKPEDTTRQAAAIPPSASSSPKINKPEKTPLPPAAPSSTTPMESKAADQDLEPVSDRFLNVLSRESQWLVKQILKSCEKGTLTGVVANLENGLGISAEELSAHGMPTPDFMNDLSSRNWLWTDKSRPLRKVHRIEVNGKSENLMVILPHVARGLGFDWRPPSQP